MANANALALNKALDFTAWGVFIDAQLLATFDTKAQALRWILLHGIRAYATIEQI